MLAFFVIFGGMGILSIVSFAVRSGYKDRYNKTLNALINDPSNYHKELAFIEDSEKYHYARLAGRGHGVQVEMAIRQAVFDDLAMIHRTY